MRDIVFAVLTISDTCSQDASKDKSGPRLTKMIRTSFQNVEVINDIVEDDRELITQKLLQLINAKSRNDAKPVNVIVTTGGTGFAPRDVTPEATKPLLTKECPQLSMAIALYSLQKTKFAALTRGLCGIIGSTLIMNFPGSEKAVIECFDVVRDLLPHAIHLINDELRLVQNEHAQMRSSLTGTETFTALPVRHVCPHKTKDHPSDRNSPYQMIPVAQAVQIILQTVKPVFNTTEYLRDFVSSVNIPPFRASIKDGYAMKSSGFSGTKKVVAYISAGDEICRRALQEDECVKINTGAPLPVEADSVVQVEDTRLSKINKNGQEEYVDILVDPKINLDVRQIGSDLQCGDKLFPVDENSPAIISSLLASVGERFERKMPTVAIISTGNELIDSTFSDNIPEGKIFDSNTIMLEQFLNYMGFEVTQKAVTSDDFDSVQQTISALYKTANFIVCSGGVSMGDKDYIKPVLIKMGFKIHFGRVNMKPGKPMTFASNGNQYFFGLPGNPVSAFVTFHLFVLPALRTASGWKRDKCELATIYVTLQNDNLELDPRPEYARATITSKGGQLLAFVNGNQISSRLQSIVGADVLLHLPARSESKTHAVAGDVLPASVLRYDFISKYE